MLDKALLHIYVIGYDKQGEGIILILENDFGVIYTAVIDCYAKDNTNKTVEILKEYGFDKDSKKKVDLICWTHPHEDHSKGMEELLKKYTDKNTTIAIPCGLTTFKYDFNSAEINNSILVINNIITSTKTKNKPHIITVQERTTIFETFLGHTNKKFSIKCLAPISATWNKKLINEDKEKINDFSIGVIVEIGVASLIFAGDMQDSTIKKVVGFLKPNQIDYIKIPHHSSKGSKAILKWFSNIRKSAIASTTVYSTSDLPSDEIVFQYQKVAKEIYCTNRKEDIKANFGVIHTVYDAINNKFYTELDGDAYSIYKDDIIEKFVI